MALGVRSVVWKCAGLLLCEVQKRCDLRQGAGCRGEGETGAGARGGMAERMLSAGLRGAGPLFCKVHRKACCGRQGQLQERGSCRCRRERAGTGPFEGCFLRA